MEKLVEAQAAKLTDARQKSLYKNSQYEELVRGLTVCGFGLRGWSVFSGSF